MQQKVQKHGKVRQQNIHTTLHSPQHTAQKLSKIIEKNHSGLLS